MNVPMNTRNLVFFVNTNTLTDAGSVLCGYAADTRRCKEEEEEEEEEEKA